ncbi:MAG: hypothetical protein K5744_06775 [Eubacterium sp.]|nr:hypothetical protein [Eubacterium sp.]
MAKLLSDHDVAFVTEQRYQEGVIKFKESGIKTYVIDGEGDIETAIKNFKPDIWVNDCLDTSAEYITWLKKHVDRVVTMEDLGSGSEVADAVINAVYEWDDRPFVNSGWKYACLRDEFLTSPSCSFKKDVERVIVMFGGTDPSNYNGLLYGTIKEIAKHYKNVTFDFITGLGYDSEKNGIVSVPDLGIEIHSDVKKVTEYMKNADIAFTSQGRTIFELAAMGIPSIVLAQNEREQTHTFAQMDHGFLNLGRDDISLEVVRNTLDWLINTPAIRKNMYDLMVCLPIRDGIFRVKNVILGNDNSLERCYEKNRSNN